MQHLFQGDAQTNSCQAHFKEQKKRVVADVATTLFSKKVMWLCDISRVQTVSIIKIAKIIKTNIPPLGGGSEDLVDLVR